MNLRYVAAYDSKNLVHHDWQKTWPDVGVTRALRRATVYFWDNRIAELAFAVASQTVDPDTRITREDLEQVHQQGPSWWWLEPPVLKPPRAGIGILFYAHHDDLVFGAVSGLAGQLGSLKWSIPIETPLTDTHRWKIGEKVWTEPDAQKAFALTGLVIAGRDWIRQRLFETVRATPPRHARKRAERLDSAATITDIEVVHLRLKTRLGQLPPVGDDRALIEWTCQWMVSGHPRLQYYPKAGTHRRIWIKPYRKGPDDKPLKLPSPRLFAVVR